MHSDASELTCFHAGAGHVTEAQPVPIALDAWELSMSGALFPGSDYNRERNPGRAPTPAAICYDAAFEGESLAYTTK